ncbi:hypothetical protein OX284_006130 [Flavobacterium sp. SUN046]|uniref:hypothetical protein n=1 Tax=Flavobacterium sp. SUN046 TaxID=3002440 RepID=UPI002DBD74D6|nr:hypothetical protein [Flavobacterium sp. SUN046]MEC4048998.1 hypothetical protein [Flavobacterium sp. SUN046]
MARQNLISAEVDDVIVEAVLQHLLDSKTAMPFLINLSKSDRMKYRKMGPKSVEYVGECLVGAQQFSNHLTADFPLGEYEKDVKLIRQLFPILVAAQALAEGLNDTILALGSDCMDGSNEVYDLLKNAAKKDANVKTLVDQLARRYKGQGRKTKSPPQA